MHNVSNNAGAADKPTVLSNPNPTSSRAPRRAAVRYVVSLGVSLALFYAFVYHPWNPVSLVGQQLKTYLELIARLSAAVLELSGEHVSVNGPSVHGRFPYVVVVDCAALDIQALFVAAVLAFPSRWFQRVVGFVCGLVAIFSINIARLVALYYAGVHSKTLFKTLHEEVFVLVVVVIVCGLFLLWATWATRHLHTSHELPSGTT
jgi:exosortase/archaeosortase family protein